MNSEMSKKGKMTVKHSTNMGKPSDAKMKCEKCGKEQDKMAAKCPECGGQMKMMITEKTEPNKKEAVDGKKENMRGEAV